MISDCMKSEWAAAWSDRVIAELKIAEFQDGVGLLSDGVTTVIFAECPECGCKWMATQDRGWMNADPPCPACGDDVMGWTNPFYSRLYDVDIGWNGADPASGVAMKSLVREWGESELLGGKE